ncbi:sugar ABC transporter substrate-binding protein [Kaistia geumhonensis]|uniref:Multiple sugar transport system substrate-binding protein n=1 Tax=Kaistia geumhonensis TaxID=410839 RepID=A0ABU0M7W3_9HYPH|nr:sugar ABC transporter substrate-binding protein [Kaistia geumhonensis]MCX5477735.1 sugar ABC transporter substrate-binding protein [Kaistia geumhonensis]MDQ0517054.1 multiple sugar transport system substrate-binding protein [Kaistia geumhonensis]
MNKLLRTTVALAALALAMPSLAVPALADDAKPLAGQSITVLLPSGQSPNIASDFEKETGIKVDLQMLSWDDIRPKLITGLIAGTPPADVTEFDWSWTGQFGAAGWYEDLTPLVDAETIKDMPTASIFTVDGKLLGVPYANDFRILIANKDHLAKAGITKMPTTIDELVADAKLIKEKGIAEYPLGVPLSPTEGTSTLWYLMTFAFGGDLFDKDWKPLFTSPDSGGYKALQFYVDMLKAGLIDPASTGLKDSDVHQMFMDGKVTFDLGVGPGWVGAFEDKTKSKIAGNTTLGLVPTASGKTVSYGLPEALGIPAASEKKEAALAFVKWMTSKDEQIKLAAEQGLLATRTSAFEELNKQGKILDGDVVIEQAGTVGPLFKQGTPTWYPQFSSAVNNAINQAAKGEISVADAVKSIADETAKAQQQ